jgi:isoleucyl-tRNA synthetase
LASTPDGGTDRCTAQVDPPALDHEVLRFWQAHDLFAHNLAHNRGQPDRILHEGLHR